MTTTAGDPPSRSVLVVEDDRIINDALAERFRACGYAVHQAWDGPGAVTAFAEHEPDVVLLDLMLPGFDGLEVCRRIQAQHPVPVLMITARDEEADIVLGLGVGADDYITKPFRMREVTARVEALLRRVDRANELAAATPPTGAAVEHDGLRLDPRTRRCTVDGEEVHLTPTEFELLALLAADPGTVVRRGRIVHELWGWEESLGSRTLDSHVKSLRAKVGGHRVRTVHGVGYALADGEGGEPR
ncbi:response regulator transcription factor [Marihabitans asiaticum]|uniref:DNA-binding response OmpR family regulator n=1 Tax=Marihabitans asiaticum TaxID=415218 RepID=A0A560WD26_9MICO|nr:response regulator transcription factor [Marihabitans asiaticum]TWD15470.1 DNA-binding response OmpR family regulator [Marihabitans asiaticum]